MADSSNEDQKTELMSSTSDGFSGFVDTYEGGEEDVNPRMIEGTRIKFTNDGRWVDAEDTDLDASLELIVVKAVRCVQKWGPDQRPIETKILGPNEPYPNIKALNEACPQSEWREDPGGKLVGPWQPQRVLYFVDPVSLDKYTYPTSTIGGTRAVHELVDKIAWMQKYRGKGIVPKVRFASAHMPTRFGGRSRPHFQIVCWVAPGSGEIEGGQPAPLPKPDQVADTAAGEIIPPTPAMKTVAPMGTKTVTEPSLSEEMNDTIPF
jgi:hypothetical protein